MKHVSWIVALVVGFAVGFVGRGAVDFGGRPPRQAAPAQRPQQRPVEDPKAVYRVAVGDSPVRGPADALVTIVESSDFQCPFCKRGAATMKQIEDLYRGKVRFVFKHNPLSFHPQAMPAALAAEEARAEGGDAKFWALHDALFESAPALDEAAIEKAAQGAGLDVAKVKAAMSGATYRDRIVRDQQEMVRIGAPATPTFFVNGRKLAGAQPVEAFRAAIDEELRKAQQLVEQGTPASEVYAKIIERGATAPVYLPGTAPAAGTAAAPSPAAPAAPAAPPPALYRKVSVRADDPARGPKDAKLTVVLFSDFQCPFCSRVEPTLKQLEEAFPGQVRIVWKHQPLAMHPQAMPAALAAEAAREQGKFWPMHDRLFAGQATLSPDAYEQSARAIGLDVKRFQAAVAAKRGAERIAQDQQEAAAVGANGTPTMFFNCRQVVGALPFERLRPIAEEELKKADALLRGGKPGPDFADKACQANVALAPAAAAPAQQGAIVPAALQVPVQGLTIRPDDPVRGNPKAPVTIVLFSDFQCPFCSRVEPTLEQVQKVYGDKVRIVWKHQPLPFHPNAMPAAEAAEAAREQGKFWQMHGRLFQSQSALSDALYDQIAKEIGLDVRRFDDARRSGRARARIAEDQALAARIGAQATPTMFVNGVKVEGAVPFEQIKAVVDQQLARR